MNGKQALGIFVVMVAIGAGIFFLLRSNSIPAASNEQIPVSGENARGMSIEQYITENISTLAPEPAVLGGTYFVTDIQTEGGSGIVGYEDGHNAYDAEFTYTIDEQHGGITITSFRAVKK